MMINWEEIAFKLRQAIEPFFQEEITPVSEEEFERSLKVATANLKAAVDAYDEAYKQGLSDD